MGYGSDSGSQDDKDEDDDEDYEESGESNRLLGFMFGNVDNSGDLDVDYLDEDAKEHLSALADKLGSSLTDINLSVKSSHKSGDTEEDYDEKAEDAVDYEDMDEQYEGPEIQAAGEEDYLLPKRVYLSSEVSLATLKPTASVFDDEDYDEEVEPQEEAGDNALDAQITAQSDEQGKVPEVDSVVGKTSEDDRQTASSDAESLGSGPEESEDEQSDKGSTPLPILCIEDGKPILRFSELFGIKDPVRKREKREHKYAFRASHKLADISNIVEDDEEEFLTGSSHGVIYLKHEDLDKYESDNSVYNNYESESETTTSPQGIRKDSCFPGEPMNNKFDHSIGTQVPLSPTFHPLDQLDWEVGIVWDNSPTVSENYCISKADSEASVDSEPETESPQNNVHEPQREHDEKTHDKFVNSSPVILEHFGSRTSSGPSSRPFSECRYHPQLLRLHSRSIVDGSDQEEGWLEKVNEKKLHRDDALANYDKRVLRNRDMLDGSWLDDIIWDQEKPIRKPKLILDLQDEQMLFEVLDKKDGMDLRLHAGAMIITRSVKFNNGNSLELQGHGGTSGWRQVANDKHYSGRKTSQQMKSNSKKRTTQGVKIYHSQPALTLQTIKLKLSNKDLANFHRPKALWYPHDNEVAVKEQGKLSTKGPMKVIIKSVGGKGSKLHVDAEETVSSVKAKASKKLDFKLSETVKIFYLGKELEDDKTLSAQNVQPNSLLHLVRTKIHVLPRAQKLPSENKSSRPPGAFKKKSDLSPKDGHVFLMEYCEERPLLLSNIGMGARLCTYYQKSAPDDQTASVLRSTDNTLGHVIALNPADKSPFLGDIKQGSYQSSLETNMYRAPVFPHKVPLTDYLLIRSPKGKISLRRIDRLNVVGQQEPLMEVMSPGTKTLQNYMMNRLLVHMCLEFRAAEKSNLLPYIRAEELPSQFPYISDIFLRKKLKEFAYLQRGSNAQLIWVKKRNVRIFTDDELRNMVKPEEVCAYESMQAGLYRLKHLGITETHPSAILSAMSRLPDEAIALAAASHIERELLITPWNLSSNFVASTQGKENIERLEITGVGDPSGRGLGFSYVRAVTKAPVASATAKKKSAAGKGGTNVTGTDADLRRLSMEAAREVLLKFDVPDEVIAKQTRWHRIAMIRKLSSEQAEAGVKVDPTTISKYARGQRMSFLQLQQQTREKCQEIWDRQAQSLTAFDGDEIESDSEANNSDLDSFAGDLENLLDAEECEDEVDGIDDDADNHEKGDGVKGLKMRRRPSLAQAEEEIEDEAAEAAELCRLLMDDEIKKNKKKKTKGMGEESAFTSGPRTNYTFENVVDRVKPIIANQPAVSYVSKENTSGDTKVEIILKKNKPAKIKPKIKTDDILTLNLTNKKLKIAGEIKIFKEKKSARESFVCGACGQLGHMRTNKNCPKYGDPDAHADVPESEKSTGKASSSGPSQIKTVTKKLIPKSATKIALVETSEGENYTPPSTKFLPVKFKCGTTEKSVEKTPQVVTLSIDQPGTSDQEAGKSSVKINKIIISNKLKPEEPKFESHKPQIVIRPPAELDKVQIECQKPTIVIRPPANTERDRFEPLKIPKWPIKEAEGEQPLHKKLIIKRPKEVIDVDSFGLDGGSGIEHRKTKKIVELSSFEVHPKQEIFTAEGSKKKRTKDNNRKWWEEQERQRNEERQKEERERRIREERIRVMEEQEKLEEIRRYEIAIKRETEEEERRKAKKKKKKMLVTYQDDYFEDSIVPRRFDNRIPERSRSAKRKPVVEHRRSASEYGVFPKRRRGGEVNLANILEQVVDRLKERQEVSLLFLRPVTKKEAPDYLDIIERPMDLSTIKEKVRKMEYKSREQFRHDVWQIAFNAHKYNDGRNPQIPPKADQLLEICDYLLNENDDTLNEAEAGIE